MARRLLGVDDSFGRSRGVRSLGSSELELRLRDAPFGRSVCDDFAVLSDAPLILVARYSVGGISSGVRGLPTASGDSKGVPGTDEWLLGRGGFNTVPRETSSSLSLLKAVIAMRR
ncbi:hypothetical protein Q7P35_000184 [Cladosporium inversicolor]